MKNKLNRVGLYDPYLDTLGGGEKYVLSIMDVFADLGYEINIIWDKDIRREIKERFALRCIDTSKFINIKNLKNLSSFEYFFYVTDGSYFFSGAKKNFVYAMIPDKKLYSLTLINRLKLINYKFITHSLFTQKWLKKFNIDSVIIMPYLDDKLICQNTNFNKKEKIILSVGRFFSHLHSKRQDLIIRAFKNLKNKSKEFIEYKLILAGGLMKEDQKYFSSLKKLADNDSSIIFKPNIELSELYKLYGLSTYYWHFAGLGVDEEKNPELVEHFGITPLEAMASGCLTYCYSAGGPKELIIDGKNGFLFTDTDKLIDKMIKVNSSESLKKRIMNNGKLFVKENFSYQVFREKVIELFKVRP
ncbi:MAG: glycosyltransferase family 4 protein [Patescibacteria group bacterium]|jgi:glycosyltransferase involved in cell wall biosynthesis